jgi:PAS domain S-box-containing protein
MPGNVKAFAADPISREWSRRYEVRAESFLHAIPDLLFLIHRDGTYLDFQPTKDIRPYVPPGEFLGKRVQDVLPKDVAVPFQNLIAEALATGQMQSMEYLLSMDGAPRKYEARIVPSEADQVLVIVRDITELDRPLAARQQVEACLHAIFDDLSDAIAIVHCGTLAFVNRALVNLFGYPTPARLAGCPVLDLIAAESRMSVERVMRGRTGSQLVPSTYRARGLRCDGSTFRMEVHESEYQQDEKFYSAIRFRSLGHPYQTAVSPLNGLPVRTARAHHVYTVRDSRSLVDFRGTDTTDMQIPEGLGYGLTSREAQVLRMIALGLSTKQVAATLGIAYKTADTHRTHLMQKLGVHETAGIVRCAIRFGLVEP